MYFNKSLAIILFITASVFSGCQKDIPVLGEDENADSVKQTAFINAIILRSFPGNDPLTGMPWDSIQSSDSLDKQQPDIFFSYYYKSEEQPPFLFDQATHFDDVLPLFQDNPLVYYLTPPQQVPSYYMDTTFYLKIWDLDFINGEAAPALMDSIPFSISNKGVVPNPTSIHNYGFNGSEATLLLTWQ